MNEQLAIIFCVIIAFWIGVMTTNIHNLNKERERERHRMQRAAGLHRYRK